ncbi:MAG: hypothetical protein HY352_05830 [Candidatus Omnitrophica bacterium]|nr:hypothetical protein [Candidatus Omnitrophota bacterium]
MTKSGLANEVIQEIRTLPPSELREVRAYVYFLKARDTIDPTQLYFWSKRWQAWEREAEADKRSRRLVGNGTLKGLLKALKRR